MQVSLEQAGPCAAKVTFYVPREDFEREVRRALTQVARNARMKGFRPGKIPPQVVERTHGAQIRKEAMAHFVQQAYYQAIKENDLAPVGFERLNPDDLALETDGSFGHEFEISLRPEIELGQIKSLEVESQLAPTLDQEVEAALADVKRQRSRPEPTGERGLAEDGLALIDLTWEIDGATVLERRGLRVSPLDTPPGVDVEEYRQGMIGKSVGETLELPLRVPEGFEQPELVGREGTSRFTVQQTFDLVAPPDEELFALFGVENAEQLHEHVRAKIDEAKREQEDRRIEGVLVERIVEAHEMELPERMVEDQTEGRLAQLAKQLGERGADEETIQNTLAGERENAAAAARKGVKALFLFQAIAKQENLLVSRDELDAQYAVIAQRNNATAADVKRFYEENRMVDQMALEILERKVRAWLRENAVVNEPR